MATNRTRRPAARRPGEIVPCRVEWAGPEGSRIVLDEDGISFHVCAGSTMRWAVEECDLDRLLKVIAAAKTAKRQGFVNMPVPPTREEAAAYSYHQQQKYLAREAIRAINEHVEPTLAQF